MTTKRKTKQQREAEQKAALLRRVTDVYSGAIGSAWTEDDFATAEILGEAVYALKQIFGPQQGDLEWTWAIHNLKHFDNPRSAADFLFEHGFRA